MADPFHNAGANPYGLVTDMVPVTPSDDTDNVGVGNVAVGLYVETGGVVVFVTKAGTERTITVGDLSYLTCSITRVKATGTTATGVHALVT